MNHFINGNQILQPDISTDLSMNHFITDNRTPAHHLYLVQHSFREQQSLVTHSIVQTPLKFYKIYTITPHYQHSYTNDLSVMPSESGTSWSTAINKMTNNYQPVQHENDILQASLFTSLMSVLEVTPGSALCLYHIHVFLAPSTKQ